MKNTHWAAFFSQTGSEIVEIAQTINIWPDVICTNRQPDSLSSINSVLLEKCFDKILFLPRSPSAEEYDTALSGCLKYNSSVVTLHGYLRIIPAEICNTYNIYNGHPGDIIDYPELKGFNPQEKAHTLGLKKTGCVLHRVIPEVDSGQILKRKTCNINSMSLSEIYKALHKTSIDLWVEFFVEQFNLYI